MKYVEITGVITGVISVYLLYRNHIFTWPVGFINILCFLWMFYNEQLFGDCLVQILFLSVGIWGWIHWDRQEDKRPGTLSFLYTVMIWGVTLGMVPAVSWVLEKYTSCSYPMAEAAILNLSITGQWLTASRKIQSWLFWLVADVLMCVVYYLKDLHLTSLYAAGLFILGILGWAHWAGLKEKGPGSSDPNPFTFR